MRMPEPRSSRQLNQLATQLQGEAEISGVNASGTQISSRAFEMVTEFECEELIVFIQQFDLQSLLDRIK